MTWGSVKLQSSDLLRHLGLPPFSNLCLLMVSDHCYESKFKFSLQHNRNAKGQKVNILHAALYKQRICHAGVISAAAHPGNSGRQSHYVFVHRILFFPTGLKEVVFAHPALVSVLLWCRMREIHRELEGRRNGRDRKQRKKKGCARWHLGVFCVWGVFCLFSWLGNEESGKEMGKDHSFLQRLLLSVDETERHYFKDI